MTEPLRIFASLFDYPLGKQSFPHIEEAIAAELAKGEASERAGFRTLARLRHLAEVVAFVKCDTLISRARCFASGAFLRYRPELPLWVSVDDDVDASVDALRFLVEACRPPPFGPQVRDGAIIFGAMKTRTAWQIRYNVGFDGVDGDAGGEWKGRTHKLYPLSHGGAALMAVPRAALEAMCARFPELYFEQEREPGSDIIDRNPALFREALVDGEVVKGRPVRVWLGEDVMFSRRAEMAGVPRYGFIHPGIVHAGIPSV